MIIHPYLNQKPLARATKGVDIGRVRRIYSVCEGCMRSRRGHAHLSAAHARRSHADPTPCLGAAQRAPTRPTRHARACTHALERAMRTRSNVSHIAASHTHTPHPQAQKPKAPKQRSVTFFIMMLAEFFWRTNEDSTTAKPACIMMLPRAAQGARVSARCARAWSLSLSLSLPLSLARAHTYAHVSGACQGYCGPVCAHSSRQRKSAASGISRGHTT